MTIEGETTTSYPLSPRNRVKRLHERGSYDRATIHGLLDASMLCHVSYVIDGQPYCTPTFFWREGSSCTGMAAAPAACCGTSPAASRSASRSRISTVWCWRAAASIIRRITAP